MPSQDPSRVFLLKPPLLGVDTYFRGVVFDSDEIPLMPYQTENKYGVRYTYYRSQNRSSQKVNISEEKLFERVDLYMQKFQDLPPELIQGF